MEAQVACRELGFPFFLQIGIVEEPAAADNFISFTHVDCSSRLMEADVTPATLTLEECSNEFVFSSCESTVYLECRNISVAEEYGLVVFTEPRQFWVIAPNISVTIECSSLEFYCEPVSLVPLTALSAVVSGPADTCEMIAVTTTLNYIILCLPVGVYIGEGDVCLQNGQGGCAERGVVNYVIEGNLLDVCASLFGFLEAYVFCSQIGLPKLLNVTHIPLSEEYDRSTLSVSCSGKEENVSGCSIDTTDDCSDVAYLQCEKLTEQELENTVLVGVSGDPSAPFTVISPADGVYVDDCQPPSEPLYCPGVYYMERTQPSIQNIVTQLQPGQPCCDLGPIHLNITDVTCSSPTDGAVLRTSVVILVPMLVLMTVL
jgi:hypothetical protein